MTETSATYSRRKSLQTRCGALGLSDHVSHDVQLLTVRSQLELARGAGDIPS